MQIKATMRYNLTLVRVVIIKKSGAGAGPSYTVGGKANWCSHYGEPYGGSSKKLKIELPYDPAIPFLGIYPVKTII